MRRFFKKEELDNRPVTSRSVGRSHGIDGDYLGQLYKDHLRGYAHWDQKAHAQEWILTAKNMGRHLSIDESMYCGMGLLVPVLIAAEMILVHLTQIVTVDTVAATY